MGLHHATLKAAVAVYAALIGTMPDEALKAEIAKDEKGFTPEEVEEIFAALPSPNPDEQPISGEQLTAETPEWVQPLLDSNKEVIESNDSVLKGIEAFRGYAVDLVNQIVAKTQGGNTEKSEELPVYVAPEFNPDAKYISTVRLQDSASMLIYEVGEDVTTFGEEKLKKLLEKGSIKEAE